MLSHFNSPSNTKYITWMFFNLEKNSFFFLWMTAPKTVLTTFILVFGSEYVLWLLFYTRTQSTQIFFPLYSFWFCVCVLLFRRFGFKEKCCLTGYWHLLRTHFCVSKRVLSLDGFIDLINFKCFSFESNGNILKSENNFPVEKYESTEFIYPAKVNLINLGYY